MGLDQKNEREMFRAVGGESWTVLRDSWSGHEGHGGIYCAIGRPEDRERALARTGWALRVTDSRPGFSQSWTDGQKTTTYYPRGGTDTVEPLVLVREFHDTRPSYIELDQQFRLFHNLVNDPRSNNYFKPNDDGTESPAVKSDGDRFSVSTRLIRQYQAARQMDLLLFIDSVAIAPKGTTKPEEEEYTDAFMHGSRNSGDLSDGRVFTRFLATRIIPPGSIENSGIWPFEEKDDHFPEFVIGHDDEGRPRYCSCDPDKLANSFGTDPNTPNYLTLVQFRREVLQKYYEKPELYVVEDGYLRCAGLWGIQIDNDQDDRVIVFLGDLGRDLPAAERDYWRSFMVIPDGKLSETGISRAILAQFADSKSPDLVFRRLYGQLGREWKDLKGWPLFIEPQHSDIHLLKRLRRPLSDSQTEFETSIKILAQLTSDAINVSAIQNLLSTKIPDEKSITRFKRWLDQENYPFLDRDIGLLRKIQELRSKVTAHLKGEEYENVLFRNLGDLRGREAIDELLREANQFLADLLDWLHSDE